MMKRSGAHAFKRNRDAILDLLMLAMSRGLHVLPLADQGRMRYSGFSLLAYDLWSAKSVLRHLLPTAGFRFGLD